MTEGQELLIAFAVCALHRHKDGRELFNALWDILANKLDTTETKDA